MLALVTANMKPERKTNVSSALPGMTLSVDLWFGFVIVRNAEQAPGDFGDKSKRKRKQYKAIDK